MIHQQDGYRGHNQWIICHFDPGRHRNRTTLYLTFRVDAHLLCSRR
jgi:hypothetical protein